jgi:type I restriction enzyme S subunit
MGSEWRQFTLGDLCTFLAGSAFAKKYQGGTKGDYPFIKVSDMNLAGNERFINDANNWISESTREKIGAKLHPKNSIAFAKIGVALTYNRRRVLTMSTILDNNMMSAIPNTDVVHSLYFYYLLTTIDFNEVLCGTSLPYLRVDDLKKIEILLPPISEQRAIAHILGSLDDKIELNRKINKTLEAMARTIFKSWFIDFDPVIDNALRAGNPIPDSMAERAEIRRQMLDENQPSSSSPLSQKAKDRKYRGSFNFSGLSEVSIDEIHGLFPDSFQDSELGAIPKGWEVITLSEFLNIIGGGTPKTKVKEYWGGDIPWFSVVDAPSETDVFVIDTEKHVTQLGVERSSTKVLRKGTTIISARGTVGKCALLGRPMAMNQSCYGIQGKNGESDYFIYFVIKRQVSDLQRSGHGSVFNTITRDTFRTIRTILPPTKLTILFEDTVCELMELILSNLFENLTLASLRDTLLPKLISGELRIQDTEKFLKEVGV